MDDSAYNGFLPLLAGFIVSLLVTSISLAIMWGVVAPWGANLRIALTLIFIVWFLFALRAFRRGECRTRKIVGFALVVIALGLYMIFVVWHSGYLTNMPISAINAAQNGLAPDTLFHVSIAQSIKNYGMPSLLIGSSVFYNYHFGSHLVFALVSLATDVPILYSYCYLYPAIFFPLFVYLIMSVSQELKLYMTGSNGLRVSDAILVMCFIAPIFIPLNILRMFGDFRPSWLISESHLVAIIFSLIFFKMLFVAHRKGYFDNICAAIVFWVLGVPFFIAISSVTKLSVGFLFCVGIVYYIVRNNPTDVRYYLLGIYYIVTMGFVYVFPARFETAFTSITSQELSFSFLHFAEHWIAKDLWGLHVIEFYFFSFIFLLVRIKNNGIPLPNIDHKLSISKEILGLICIVGTLPGLFLAVGSGSAFYFSSIQQLVAVVMLIGFDIPDRVVQFLRGRLVQFQIRFVINKLALSRVKVCIIVSLLLCCFFWCPARHIVNYVKAIGDDVQHGSAIQQASVEDVTGHWHELSQIVNVVNGRENDFYIYIDKTAEIWRRYSSARSCLLYYQAMTGVISIGGLYCDGWNVYYNDHRSHYLSPYKANDCFVKMMLGDAIIKGKFDGEKNVVALFDDKLAFIPPVGH